MESVIDFVHVYAHKKSPKMDQIVVFIIALVVVHLMCLVCLLIIFGDSCYSFLHIILAFVCKTKRTVWNDKNIYSLHYFLLISRPLAAISLLFACSSEPNHYHSHTFSTLTILRCLFGCVDFGLIQFFSFFSIYISFSPIEALILCEN